DSAALGVRMLANSGFMVAEEALKRGAIQPAPGLGQQVEHPLALRVKLEGLALGATQDFAASVTGPGGVAERLLDHELFRSALDRRQPPLAVAQDESEPTGVLGALGLFESAGQGVLVEHLSDKHVTRDADLWAFDSQSRSPRPTQGDPGGI